ncbi:hypothetical protein GCM10028805_55600 [Spirosoma harenae]
MIDLILGPFCPYVCIHVRITNMDANMNTFDNEENLMIFIGIGSNFGTESLPFTSNGKGVIKATSHLLFVVNY